MPQENIIEVSSLVAGVICFIFYKWKKKKGGKYNFLAIPTKKKKKFIKKLAVSTWSQFWDFFFLVGWNCDFRANRCRYWLEFDSRGILCIYYDMGHNLILSWKKKCNVSLVWVYRQCNSLVTALSLNASISYVSDHNLILSSKNDISFYFSFGQQWIYIALWLRLCGRKERWIDGEGWKKRDRERGKIFLFHIKNGRRERKNIWANIFNPSNNIRI